MRTLYLYILDTLADWEFGHVIAELHSGRYLKDPSLRYRVILCGRTLETITTMGNLHLTPEILIEDIRPGPDDILILPGADQWLDPAQVPAVETTRRLLRKGRVVAAICGATLCLANAGLLDERPHTSNDLQALKMCCPSYHGDRFYVNAPAVTDRNLITASGLAPVDFARHVFMRMDVMSGATLDAWYRLFTTRAPDAYYSLVQSLPQNPGPR